MPLFTNEKWNKVELQTFKSVSEKIQVILSLFQFSTITSMPMLISHIITIYKVRGRGKKSIILPVKWGMKKFRISGDQK